MPNAWTSGNYIVEACAAADAARGKRVLVVESEDGTVRIEHNGAVLAARAFPKDARVHHGAIVENKVLAGAPEAIQVKQHERDEKLKRFRRTLREKDQFQRTLEPAVREKDKPPTVAPHALLGGALAWAQEFARHESARRSS